MMLITLLILIVLRMLKLMGAHIDADGIPIFKRNVIDQPFVNPCICRSCLVKRNPQRPSCRKKPYGRNIAMRYS